MAKVKRRSNRKQASKETLAKVRYGQRHGLISKRAKTGGGKISRGVEKKVAVLDLNRLLPTFEPNPNTNRLKIASKPQAKAIKVPKKLREEMKSKGYDFIDASHAVAPSKEEKRAQEALDNGQMAGMQSQEIFAIQLDKVGINNYADLRAALRRKEFDKKLIGEDRLYSFTFYGFHPRGDRQFISGKELLKYLEHYQWTDEAFDNFELVTIPFGESLGPTPAYVYERAREARGETYQGRMSRRARTLMLRAKRADEARDKRMSIETAEKKAKQQAAYRERKKAALGVDAYKAKDAARKRAARRKR